MSSAIKTKYESKHFYLIIEQGKFDGPCKGLPVYKLINKENGLVEGESLSIVDSLQALIQRTVALEEVLEYYNGPFQTPGVPTEEVYH